jgi:hypothetical protein
MAAEAAPSPAELGAALLRLAGRMAEMTSAIEVLQRDLDAAVDHIGTLYRRLEHVLDDLAAERTERERRLGTDYFSSPEQRLQRTQERGWLDEAWPRSPPSTL